MSGDVFEFRGRVEIALFKTFGSVTFSNIG